MPESRTFQFEQNLNDIRYRLLWRAPSNSRQRIKMLIVFFLFPLLLGAAFLPAGRRWAVIAAICGFLAWGFLAMLLVRARHRRIWIGPCKITIDPAILTIHSDFLQRQIAWMAIGRIEKTPRGLVFTDALQDRKAIAFIPNRAFVNLSECDQIQAQCRDYQIAAASAAKASLSPPRDLAMPPLVAPPRQIGRDVVHHVGCMAKGIIAVALLVMLISALGLAAMVMWALYTHSTNPAYSPPPTTRPAAVHARPR